MSKETATILRSLLFTVKTTQSVEEIEDAIEAMCDGEDIASVEAALAKRARRASADK